MDCQKAIPRGGDKRMNDGLKQLPAIRRGKYLGAKTLSVDAPVRGQDIRAERINHRRDRDTTRRHHLVDSGVRVMNRNVMVAKHLGRGGFARCDATRQADDDHDLLPRTISSADRRSPCSRRKAVISRSGNPRMV